MVLFTLYGISVCLSFFEVSNPAAIAKAVQQYEPFDLYIAHTKPFFFAIWHPALKWNSDWLRCPHVYSLNACIYISGVPVFTTVLVLKKDS